MWGIYLLVGFQSLIIAWLVVQWFKFKSVHEPKGVPKMENSPKPPCAHKKVESPNHIVICPDCLNKVIKSGGLI